MKNLVKIFFVLIFLSVAGYYILGLISDSPENDTVSSLEDMEAEGNFEINRFKSNNTVLEGQEFQTELNIENTADEAGEPTIRLVVEDEVEDEMNLIRDVDYQINLSWDTFGYEPGEYDWRVETPHDQETGVLRIQDRSLSTEDNLLVSAGEEGAFIHYEEDERFGTHSNLVEESVTSVDLNKETGIVSLSVPEEETTNMELFNLEDLDNPDSFTVDELISSQSISPNGEYIALVTEEPDWEELTHEGMVLIYSLEDQERVTEIDVSEKRVNDLVWSPDSNYLALGSQDESTYIIEADSWDEIERFDESEAVIDSVSWSPEGSYVAYGNRDQELYVHEAETWEKAEKIKADTTGITGRIRSITWSPEESYIVFSEDMESEIYETETWEKEAALEEPTGARTNTEEVVWTEDGEYLIEGFTNGNIYIYRRVDIEEGEPVGALTDYVTPDEYKIIDRHETVRDLSVLE